MPEQMNAKIVFDAEKKGDDTASALIDRFILYLTYGIAGYINVFAPEIVTVGGGISRQGKEFSDRIERALKKKLLIKR